jgi:hypothetical protein
MAKRRSDGGGELNLDSLMDAVTNVVGVLMIVLVIMALNTAQMVQKILSDLPPVTEEQHQEMLAQLKALPPPPADPKKVEEDKVLAEQALKKAIEDLKTVDTTDIAKNVIFLDLDSFRKKLDDAKKDREKEKVETDKLLAEVERLKALLDQTPVYAPPPPTYVRLPNPRPYPKDPSETRILVAQQGVIVLNEETFIKPILDGLDKVKSQLEYKDVAVEPFKDLLLKVLGNETAIRQAWPEISPLAATFQMDQVAMAYKELAVAQLQPNKNILTSLGDIAITIRSTLPKVAEAVVAATKGDLAKWTALDPSRDPTKPTIKASVAGGKITFVYGSAKPAEVKVGPKEVLGYFVKDLAGLDAIKNKSRSKIIYDAYKIRSVLERAASNPLLSGSYTITPTIRPGSVNVVLDLTPKPGGGETLDQMKIDTSNYQRLMRQIKSDPKGVAVFQVMSDAYSTYLEARKIADDIGVAATWEFLAKLDQTITVRNYEVQRFTLPPDPRPPLPDGTVPVTIAAPKKGLD